MLSWLYRVRIIFNGRYLQQYFHGASIEPWGLQDTEPIPTLRLPIMRTFPDTEGFPRLTKVKTRSLLYFDQEMRATYHIENAEAKTEELIEKAVLYFEYEIGRLPDEIILCPFRYFNSRSLAYESRPGIKIPYRFDSGHEFSYDVLVRSDPPKVLATCSLPCL